MLTKNVNGEDIVCSAEEEAAILAEWAKNDLPPTAQEIDDAKTAQALARVESPQMQAAIEEITAILQSASIPVPADVLGNIVTRCKAKL